VPDGLSVEVWREVAQRVDVRFQLESVDTIDEALRMVAAGELDAAVGPISITAKRARAVRFTQPYFHSSLAIVAPSNSGGVWQVVKPFISRAFLYGTGTLLAVLLLVGVLFWYTERKKNPEMFPRHQLKGIGNGIWLALLTMTTVGYGDRVPITTPGRIVGGVWMVIAMLTVSSLTAGRLSLARVLAPSLSP
jgi:polar amino acid transport system substrate-binding protein